MVYDFGKVNYSIRGSFLTVSKWENEFVISTARRWDDLGVHEVFRIIPGETVATRFNEAELRIEGKDNQIALCLVGQDDLRIQGTGCGFTLTHREYEGIYVANMAYEKDSGVLLANYVNNCFEWITPLRGRVVLDAPKTKSDVKHDYIHIHVQPDETGQFEVVLEQFFSPSFYHRYQDNTYDDCVARNKADYLNWEAPFCCQSDADCEAVYVMWSNICSKDNNFVDDAMLMSKSGMIAVWSWDNCINALGLAKAHPEFALSQFLLPYRYMDAFGCMPDAIYEWRNERVFVKPPVQGWIYRKLVKSNSYFATVDVISQIYPLMKQNTLWWLNFRSMRPYYLHGNDSGADNATCFDECARVATGELSALLSVQCAVLSEMAQVLHATADGQYFAELAAELRRQSVEDFFDGRLFVRSADDGEPIYSQALLPYRVIVLERELPEELKAYIINELKDKYITKFGLSSEPVISPKFVENGYWRGAVWPPDQVIFLLSLAECGEEKLAKSVAVDYLKCVGANGFYENLSALSGTGLRCTGYTWAASGYYALKNLLGD